MKFFSRLKPFFIVVIFLFIVVRACFPAVPIQKASLGAVSPASARAKLIAAAESYLGTPYRYGGLDSGGLDCSGLVYVSFRDSLKISVPRTAERLYSWTERITEAEMRQGDLVFFVTTGSRVSHVGIYAGDNRFIHAPSEGSRTGVMYSRLDEPYWKRAFTGAGRALPWDEETEQFPADTAGSGASQGGAAGDQAVSQAASSKGLFTGIGIAPALGGFIDGSVFRGIVLQAKIGYKGLFFDSSQISVEIRPEWDRFLGIYRFAVVLSAGNEYFQVFAGPAGTMGTPEIHLGYLRTYKPGFSWLGEAGFNAALPPFKIANGSLSIFVEAAWQPYFSNEEFNLAADLAANLRLSLGLRYLWFSTR